MPHESTEPITLETPPESPNSNPKLSDGESTTKVESADSKKKSAISAVTPPPLPPAEPPASLPATHSGSEEWGDQVLMTLREIRDAVLPKLEPAPEPEELAPEEPAPKRKLLSKRKANRAKHLK